MSSQSLWANSLRRSARMRRVQVGVLLVGVVVALSIVGPFISPYSPSETAGLPNATMNGDNLLGTDSIGRDVLSRVLHGGWSILWMSVAATTIGLAVGTVLGLIAGTAGRRTDEVLVGGTDVVMAFPQVVLALLVVSMLDASSWLIVLVVALTHAPRVARLVRGLTLEISRREFVEASQVLGLPRRKILAREILPNLSTPLAVEFGVRLIWSVALIAGLAFLGLVGDPSRADWGRMIDENRLLLPVQPWAALAPLILIAVLSVGVNLVTDGFARAVAGIDRADGEG